MSTDSWKRTKSPKRKVSRHALNAKWSTEGVVRIDSLSAIRLLKSHNVEIYFEKENIWIFDSKGELLITIMSSMAQEESRSISENVRWGSESPLPTERCLSLRKAPTDTGKMQKARWRSMKGRPM